MPPSRSSHASSSSRPPSSPITSRSRKAQALSIPRPDTASTLVASGSEAPKSRSRAAAIKAGEGGGSPARRSSRSRGGMGSGAGAGGGWDHEATVAERIMSEAGVGVGGVKVNVMGKIGIRGEKITNFKQPELSPSTIIDFSNQPSFNLRLARSLPNHLRHSPLPRTFILGKRKGKGQALVYEAWAARLREGRRAYLPGDEVGGMDMGPVVGWAKGVKKHVGGAGTEVDARIAGEVKMTDGWAVAPATSTSASVAVAGSASGPGSASGSRSGVPAPASFSVVAAPVPAAVTAEVDTGEEDEAVHVGDGGDLVGGERKSAFAARVEDVGEDVEMGGTSPEDLDMDLPLPGTTAAPTEDVKTAPGEARELDVDDFERVPGWPVFALKMFLLPPDAADALKAEYGQNRTIIDLLPQDQRFVAPVLLEGHCQLKQKENAVWEGGRWTGLLMELYTDFHSAFRAADKPTSKRLLQSFVQAVNHFNAAGWSHRDIKIANAVVAEDGEVLLIDVGSATPINQAIPDDSIGTNEYLSPSMAAKILSIAIHKVFSDLAQKLSWSKYFEWSTGSGSDIARKKGPKIWFWAGQVQANMNDLAHADQDAWSVGCSLLEILAPGAFAQLCCGASQALKTAEAILLARGQELAFGTAFRELRTFFSKLVRWKTWKAEVDAEYHEVLSECLRHPANNSLTGEADEAVASDLDIGGLPTLGDYDMTARPTPDRPVGELQSYQPPTEEDEENLAGTDLEGLSVWQRTAAFADDGCIIRPNAVQLPFTQSTLKRIPGSTHYTYCVASILNQSDTGDASITYDEAADTRFLGFAVDHRVFGCSVPGCRSGASAGMRDFEARKWDTVQRHFQPTRQSTKCPGLRHLPEDATLTVEWLKYGQLEKQKKGKKADDE